MQHRDKKPAQRLHSSNFNKSARILAYVERQFQAQFVFSVPRLDTKYGSKGLSEAFDVLQANDPYA